MLTTTAQTVDRSGSITAGGTAQDIYSAQQKPRLGFEFFNTSDTVMYLDFGTNATTTRGIPVPAGGSYYLPGAGGVVPSGRLSVLCATTGKAFVCKTW